MSFCPWYPLREAERHAPPRPGVYQVRVAQGLVDYPRGKSAMVHYGLADDLRTAASSFAAAHPSQDWLCRHATEAGDAAAASLFHSLVTRFRTRFGAEPRVHP